MIKIIGTIGSVWVESYQKIHYLVDIDGEKRVLPFVGDSFVSGALHKRLEENINLDTMIVQKLEGEFETLEEVRKHMNETYKETKKRYTNIAERNIEIIKKCPMLDAETEQEHNNRVEIFALMVKHGLPRLMDISFNLSGIVGKHLGNSYLGSIQNAYMLTHE